MIDINLYIIFINKFIYWNISLYIFYFILIYFFILDYLEEDHLKIKNGGSRSSQDQGPFKGISLR